MPKRVLGVFIGLGVFFTLGVNVSHASTTYYFSPTFEKTDGVITKYYSLPGGATVVKKNNELNYLHTDQISSNRLVTSNQGQMNSQLDYFPYGNLQSINNQSTINTLPIDHLYTSQILDSSTNLYFYNARQYNPATGAFISADSAQGSNRYAYVSGNPINMNDPTGNINTPYAGDEPSSWQDYYRQYGIVFREELPEEIMTAREAIEPGGMPMDVPGFFGKERNWAYLGEKLTSEEINNMLPVFKNLPKNHYENQTIVNSLPVPQWGVFEGFAMSEEYFGAKAHIGITTRAFRFESGEYAESVLVHELAHMNYSRERSTFVNLRGWMLNTQTSTWENSSSYLRPQIGAENNPSEDFAQLTQTYYHYRNSPDYFGKLYGPELTNYFGQYYQK